MDGRSKVKKVIKRMIDVTRRTYIKGLAIGSSFIQDTSKKRIEIGLYYDKRTIENSEARFLNAPPRIIKDTLGKALPDTDIYVGIETGVKVPDNVGTSPKSVLKWWRAQNTWDYADSNVLILPPGYPGFKEVQGYADIGGDVAVSVLNSAIVTHEVGHTLGARHKDAETWTENGETYGTLMAADGREIDRFDGRFSESAINRIRKERRFIR